MSRGNPVLGYAGEQYHARQIAWRIAHPHDAIPKRLHMKCATARCCAPAHVEAWEGSQAKRWQRWRKKDPARYKRRNRELYERHKTAQRAYERERYAMSEEVRARQKNKANLRRARMMGQAGVSPEEWLAILEWFDHRCAYCNRRLCMTGRAPESQTTDHVLALENGGRHEAANVVPACRSCNSRKADRGVLSMLNP